MYAMPWMQQRRMLLGAHQDFGGNLQGAVGQIGQGLLSMAYKRQQDEANAANKKREDEARGLLDANIAAVGKMGSALDEETNLDFNNMDAKVRASYGLGAGPNLSTVASAELGRNARNRRLALARNYDIRTSALTGANKDKVAFVTGITDQAPNMDRLARMNEGIGAGNTAGMQIPQQQQPSYQQQVLPQNMQGQMPTRDAAGNYLAADGSIAATADGRRVVGPVTRARQRPAGYNAAPNKTAATATPESRKAESAWTASLRERQNAAQPGQTPIRNVFGGVVGYGLAPPAAPVAAQPTQDPAPVRPQFLRQVAAVPQPTDADAAMHVLRQELQQRPIRAAEAARTAAQVEQNRREQQNALNSARKREASAKSIPVPPLTYLTPPKPGISPNERPDLTPGANAPSPTRQPLIVAERNVYGAPTAYGTSIPTPSVPPSNLAGANIASPAQAVSVSPSDPVIAALIREGIKFKVDPNNPAKLIIPKEFHDDWIKKQGGGQ